MSGVVYSVKIVLESIRVIDDTDAFGAGEIYALGTIDGHSTGRTPVQSVHSGGSLALAGASWSREVVVFGRTSVPVEVEVWDEELLVDERLGRFSFNVSEPWSPGQHTGSASSGKFELTWSIGSTKLVPTGPGVAIVSRNHDGSTYVSTLVAPTVLPVVRVTEIRPGRVRTGIHAEMFGGSHDEADRRVYDPVVTMVAEDVAEGILWALAKPPHLCVSQLEILATDHVVGGIRYKTRD